MAQQYFDIILKNYEQLELLIEFLRIVETAEPDSGNPEPLEETFLAAISFDSEARSEEFLRVRVGDCGTWEATEHGLQVVVERTGDVLTFDHSEMTFFVPEHVH